MHQFSTTQFLPIPIKEAWNFFSSPENLSKITPPEMAFKIISQSSFNGIYNGQLIDYRVKPMLGIPVKWRTEICDIVTHKYFTDRQLIGPYEVWEHTHTFNEVEGGVLMRDEVNYKLPLGIIGQFINALVVKDKISKIFEYRESVLKQLFPLK